MITTIITALLTSKAVQALGAVLVALVAWFGNNALQRRKGRLAERDKAAAERAKGYINTTKAVNDAETFDDVGLAKRWLSERDANKP